MTAPSLPLSLRWAEEWRAKAWGRSDHGLIIEKNGYSYQTVPLPSFSVLRHPNNVDPILVREEYKKIYDYIRRDTQYAPLVRADQEEGIEGSGMKRRRLENLSKKGLIIFGQPGSGKSYSLYYLLLRALEEEWAVVFSHTESHCLYFDHRGVARHSLEVGLPADTPNGILILIDTWAEFKFPSLLQYELDGYIVHATSPAPSNRKWGKQERLPNVWVIDLWSDIEASQFCCTREEISSGQSSDTVESNERPLHPLEVFKYLGPSARYMFQSPVTQHELNTWEFPALFNSAYDFKNAVVSGVVDPQDQRADFHTYFFVEPNKNVKKPCRFLTLNSAYKHVQPTTFLANISRLFIERLEFQESIRFAKSLNSCPQVAGIVFEQISLRSLVTAPTTPVPCKFKNDIILTIPPLAPVRETFDSNLTSLKFNTLYIPPPNFTTLDALVLARDTLSEVDNVSIFILQTTVALRHDVKREGIVAVHKVIRKMPGSEDWPWKFVFVAPSDAAGSALSNQFASTKNFRIEGESVKLDLGYSVMPNLSMDLDALLVSNLEELIQKDNMKDILRDAARTISDDIASADVVDTDPRK